MEEINRTQVREIIEHFKGTPLTSAILDEFCKRKGFEPVSAEQYEDYLFAYNHDQRVERALPAILAVLAKLKNVPEFASDKERDEAMKANEALQIEVCELLEEHEVLYQEVELLTGGLGSLIKNVHDGAARRTNNMAAQELLTIAEAKLGKPLTVKALGKHNRTET